MSLSILEKDYIILINMNFSKLLGTLREKFWIESFFAGLIILYFTLLELSDGYGLWTYSGSDHPGPPWL